MILDKFKIDSKEVRTASLGNARTGLAASRQAMSTRRC